MREAWGSRLGFILAAVGSAIGLANILRFPYLVGNNGGAAFIITYLVCIFLIGFPVMVAELVCGRSMHRNVASTFKLIGKSKKWQTAGFFIILTGFIVSTFYSVLAGWILGYLIEAVRGNLTVITSVTAAKTMHSNLVNNYNWAITMHAVFMALAVLVLYRGVKSGLELASKILMPLMFAVLIYLVIVAVQLPNATAGIKFLLTPSLDAFTPSVILLALGQAFFTLSAGQGTMITYGSYLSREVNLVTTALPIVIADTVISLLAAIAVFGIVFSVGMEPNQDLGLIFHTLPVVFSKISGGFYIGIAFFVLVLLAALTSEISALEPMICYLTDERGLSRQKATVLTGIAAFIVGVPCISVGVLGKVDFIATAFLIPVGGLLAVILMGWKFGIKAFIAELSFSHGDMIECSAPLRNYFKFSVKYLAPVIITVVLISKLV